MIDLWDHHNIYYRVFYSKLIIFTSQNQITFMVGKTKQFYV